MKKTLFSTLILLLLCVVVLAVEAVELRQGTSVNIAGGQLMTTGGAVAGSERIPARMIKTSKIGRAFTAYSGATAVTADANGAFIIPADTNDTYNCGVLKFIITDPNVLPITNLSFDVVKANYYDLKMVYDVPTNLHYAVYNTAGIAYSTDVNTPLNWSSGKWTTSGAVYSTDVNTPLRAANGYWKSYDPNIPAVKTDTAAIKLQTDQLVFAGGKVNANATATATVTGVIALNTTVVTNSDNSTTKVYLAKGSAKDNAYGDSEKQMLVMVVDITDPNDAQVRRIIGYDATNKAITLEAPLNFTPANGDYVYIQGYDLLAPAYHPGFTGPTY